MKFFIVFVTVTVSMGGCGLLNGQNSKTDARTIRVQRCGSPVGMGRADIPGKLVFTGEDTAGTSQIFIMSADGSDLEQLTDFDPSGEAMQPSWNPSGSRIIFSSFEMGTSDGPALWVMDADGTNKHVLYDSEPGNPHVPPLAGRNAQWSPDGKKVIFDLCPRCSASTDNSIYLFDVRTKILSKLTDHPASELYPAWSPDGNQIAFVSNRDYVDADSIRYTRDLYVMDADGTNLQRLTKIGFVGSPAWHPDGNKIAFTGKIMGNGVYILTIASGSITKIETGFEFVGNPLWNSAGTRLLVPGRKTEQSTHEMRLISLANDSCKIIQTVPLDIKGNGWYFDWYVK
jgi:Tol biopolymer transport system component